MASLTPPDTTRCQAEKPAGHTFMTLGGRPGGMVRCTVRPDVVIEENEPGRDGLRGAMSLCEHCLSVLRKQHPKMGVTAFPIGAWGDHANPTPAAPTQLRRCAS